MVFAPASAGFDKADEEWVKGAEQLLHVPTVFLSVWPSVGTTLATK